MIVSGYTLALYCDCPECQRKSAQGYSWDIRGSPRHAEFFTDSPRCRQEAFKEARAAGWYIPRDESKSIAPGHEGNRK